MLIYITGGARSGKSRYAHELAARLAKQVLFVATCTPADREMRERVESHRAARPEHWRTLESPVDLVTAWRAVHRKTELVLVDCLTMYVSARLMQGENESRIAARVEKFCKTAAGSPLTTIVVSNEVGSGVVPASELGRKFRDCAGRANQIVARYADTAYVMISGFPLALKGASLER